jgi:hypothetical protein
MAGKRNNRTAWSSDGGSLVAGKNICHVSGLIPRLQGRIKGSVNLEQNYLR